MFLTRDGKLKVLDFGIARLRETLASTDMTQTGTSMGTPAYMPPEQARGRWDDVDARTDLWAAGATLCALVTGEPVRKADTPNLALLLAMTEPIAPVRKRWPQISPGLARVLDRALAMDREQRYASADEMRAALASTSSVAADPRRAPKAIALGLAALFAIGGASTLVAMRARTDASSLAPVASSAPAAVAPAIDTLSPAPLTSTSPPFATSDASAARPTSSALHLRSSPHDAAAASVPTSAASAATSAIAPNATASASASAASYYERRH